MIGRQDLIDNPRFASRKKRGEHEAEIDAVVTEWTRKRDKHEAMRLVGPTGVPDARQQSRPAHSAPADLTIPSSHLYLGTP